MFQLSIALVDSIYFYDIIEGPRDTQSVVCTYIGIVVIPIGVID